jgi:anti-repressor protein
MSKQTVNARELHGFLEVKTAFKDWISRRIEDFGFIEDQDFCSFLSESGGRPSKEYALTVDMAKELSMVERNAKGKQARLYFIECERRAKDPMYALNDPATLRSLCLTYSERMHGSCMDFLR